MIRDVAFNLIQLYHLHDASRMGKLSGSPQHPLPSLIRLQLMCYLDGLRHAEDAEDAKLRTFIMRYQKIHPHHDQLIWVFKTQTHIWVWTRYNEAFVRDMKARIVYTHRTWDASGGYWKYKASEWPVLKALLEQYFDGKMFLMWDQTKQPYARVFVLEVKNGQSR